MKLRKLFLIATLAGTLAVIGCGDDDTTGTGGTSGTGGTTGAVCPANADTICANCEGQQLNDCQADVFACNAFDDIGACETCIEESNPGCP